MARTRDMAGYNMLILMSNFIPGQRTWRGRTSKKSLMSNFIPFYHFNKNTLNPSIVNIKVR